MLRTFLVDDEPLARQRLRRLLQPYEADNRLTIVGEAGDGAAALEALAETPADLLLLDIQMPGLDGFDVLDRLPPDHRPVVIFVTAYDAYALRAFEAHAVDYLLKPIDEQRLDEALERAERLATPGQRADLMDRLADLLEQMDNRRLSASGPAPEGSSDYLTHLSLPGRDRLLVVPVERLVAAEVQEGITRLYTLDDPDARPLRLSRHLVSHTLEALEARLDPHRFLRVHRAALVQIDHIREMVSWFSGRYKLILTGGHEIIASRARSRVLRERLDL